MIIQPYDPRQFIPLPGLLAARQPLITSHFSPAYMRPGTFITAKTRSGIIVWEGEFRSRHDAHVFTRALVSGAIVREPGLWDLPTPAWMPGLYDATLEYSFSTTITATGAGNVTSPAGAYKVDVAAWGPGGSGGRDIHSGGAGAGAYAGSSSIACSPGQSVFWDVFAGGAAQSSTAAGNPGAGQTWISVGTNSAPSSSVDGAMADFGLGGRASTVQITVAASGGLVANSIGTQLYAGGNGAIESTGASTNGGGSRGCPTSAGVTATTGSGAMAAGTDSGAGGAGAGTANGTAGTQPGGGGGSTGQSHTSGAGADGQCRYTFYLALANFLMFL